jgi:2-oxoglutarate ferredoxin oxidoreductase subunit alpha
MARWGTSGGYPIVALAPASVADCYTLTARAFDLAERFRCPVFVLADKEVATTLATVEASAFGPVHVRERELATAGAPYRYRPAGDVPPMRAYGTGEPVRLTGSTHDEGALITRQPATVDALNRHLAAKIEERLDELELVDPTLQPGAETLVIAYGVTAGAARRAAELAVAAGTPVSSLVVHSLWPVPERAIRHALEGVRRVVVPELNLGQYRREIERIAGGREVVGVNRVDGELIGVGEILEAIT